LSVYSYPSADSQLSVISEQLSVKRHTVGEFSSVLIGSQDGIGSQI